MEARWTFLFDVPSEFDSAFTSVFLTLWKTFGFCWFFFSFHVVTMARMNRPAPVEITYKNMRFLITHNPTNATLNKFIEVSVGVQNFSAQTFQRATQPES